MSQFVRPFVARPVRRPGDDVMVSDANQLLVASFVNQEDADLFVSAHDMLALLRELVTPQSLMMQMDFRKRVAGFLNKHGEVEL